MTVAIKNGMLDFKSKPLPTSSDKQQGELKIAEAFNTDSFTSGVMTLSPYSIRQNQTNHNFTEVYYVISGKVEVTIYATKVVLTTGSHFFVPRGNVYRIANIASRDCKLAFTMVK